MTEPGRSAPLSVEQETEQEARRLARVTCGYNTLNVAEEANWPLIAESLRAAHAEGVRTGRRQALLDAADAFPHSFPMQSLSGEFLVIPEWLRGFSCAPQKHTRGDEAHQDTSLLTDTTKAKKKL